MTLSKSQPWATLYHPMKRMPNRASYSRTWRGKIVFMKNLKNGSRPRRTENQVASTGTAETILQEPAAVGDGRAAILARPPRPAADRPVRRHGRWTRPGSGPRLASDSRSVGAGPPPAGQPPRVGAGR